MRKTIDLANLPLRQQRRGCSMFMESKRGLLAGKFLKAMALNGNDEERVKGYVDGRPELAQDARALIEASFLSKSFAHMDQMTKAAVPGMGLGGSPFRRTDIAASWDAALRPVSARARLTVAKTAPANSLLRLFGTPSQGYSNLGEGQPIPVVRSSFTLADVLTPVKTAAITVLSQDVLRFGTEGTEDQLTADLAAAVAAAEDAAFLLPSQPKSILHGISGVPSTGATLAAIDADLKSAIAVLVAAGSTLVQAVWIISPATAISLSTIRGTGGELAFPGVSVLGGTLVGLPVIVTAGVAGIIVLLDQAGLLLDQAPYVALDSSQEAAFEMSDTPAENSLTPTSSSNLVSLFQANSIALRAVTMCAWALVRPGFAIFVSGVAY